MFDLEPPLALVSLSEASNHLRRDTTDDNDDLQIKIYAASASIMNYLKESASFLDSTGLPEIGSDQIAIVPYPVKAACLIMVGVLYNDRDGEDYVKPSGSGNQARFGLMPLPRAAQFLLDPYRTPTLG